MDDEYWDEPFVIRVDDWELKILGYKKTLTTHHCNSSKSVNPGWGDCWGCGTKLPKEIDLLQDLLSTKYQPYAR